MKVQSVQLQHFKKFANQTFNFTDLETGLARDLILLVGMNGSGKTTLLQAIATALGTATGRLEKPADLEWPGFNPHRYNSDWEKRSEVTLNVEFSSLETQATVEFYQELNDPNLTVVPSQNHLVSLQWKNGKVQADTAANLFQFQGRNYAKRVKRFFRDQGFDIFRRVGTVFWYTEQRTATSLTPEVEIKEKLTEDLLRDRLSKWQQFHWAVEAEKIKLRPGQKDLYAAIETAYQALFYGRSFIGPVPPENIDDILQEPWFVLSDGKHQYELSEMSGGERAIFPILMDFANWNIHNSVILIDEIE